MKTVHRKRRRTSVRENREFDRKRDYNQALSLSVCVKFSIRSGLIIEAGSKGTVDNHPSVPRLDSTRSPSLRNRADPFGVSGGASEHVFR